MGKFIKFLLLVILLVVIGGVGYLAYLGFVPGLSDLIGANKPKDLGITYTKADYDDYVSKSLTKISYLPVGQDKVQGIIFSGSKDLNQSFTSRETSARINYSSWAYMPVANTQVRFNADGSVEFSGNLLTSRLNNFIAAIGGVSFTQDEINKGLSYIKTSLPIYIKVTPVSIKDNQVSLKFDSISVGKFNVPLTSFDANGFFSKLTEQVIGQIPGFYAKSVTIADGQINFMGSVPEAMQVPQA